MPRVIRKGAVSLYIPVSLVPATFGHGIDFDLLDRRSTVGPGVALAALSADPWAGDAYRQGITRAMCQRLGMA